MPFGTFRAEARAPRQARPAKAPRPAPKQAPKQPPKQPAPKPAPAIKPTASFASGTVNILLAGRNLSLLREFLCSMNQNMAQALQEEGLAFYTQELKTISSMTAVKKKLEQFFWTFSQNDWSYPADEGGEDFYRFSISSAGDQSRVLELVFHCVTPGAGDLAPGQADAVWLLTDGLLLEAGGGEDPFTRFLQGSLHTLAQGGFDRPVCLVLSQIERMGHFDSAGMKFQLPQAAAAQLTRLCQEYFLESCGSKLRPALIPVQVYGGLECAGVDSKGDPLMRMGQSGFYQSYIPENCQIPGLYTLQAITAARQQDFFPDNKLSQGIQHHYALRFSNAGWRPQALGRKEEL